MKKYLWMTFILGSLGILFLTIKHFLPYTTQNQIESIVFPGWQSADLDHLDPTFRKKAQKVMQRLAKKGFETSVVRSTYRSTDFQDFIHNISKIAQKFGKSGFTSTRNSCHNSTRKGKPAATGIDLSAHNLTILTQFNVDPNMNSHVAYFKMLGKEAKGVGLVWGGDWFSKNSVWKQYKLGWDPGHIQVKGTCKRILR
jgi:hypothetical protein